MNSSIFRHCRRRGTNESVDVAARIGLTPAMLTHDRDSKFGPEFDRALTEFGVEQTRLPYRSLNAHVERFIKTLEVECLVRSIVMGAKHPDHLVSEYAED